LPNQLTSFRKRLKREFRKTLDRLIRSNAFHKLAVKLLYLTGLIISFILAAMLYLDL